MTAIHVEGGLFPPDFLEQLAGRARRGQAPADFALPHGTRLADSLQRAYTTARREWDRFQSVWDAHQRRGGGPRAAQRIGQEWALALLTTLDYDPIALSEERVAGHDRFQLSHAIGPGPTSPPIHLIGPDRRLDERGAGRRSAHSLVQEYLNRSDALWGLTCNGLELRLLRNSARVFAPTYVAFDLRALFDGEQYADFAVLYRLLHRTRLPSDAAGAADSLLESYYHDALEEGGRVRDKLRDGVRDALLHLGAGFLLHPDSRALCDALAAGRLSPHEYYRQLLRLVYRLLFLFVAEERRLLFAPDAPADRALIFAHCYAVSPLRDRAERYLPFTPDADLWQALRQTFRLCREPDVASRLGLTALNGDLFAAPACAALEAAHCHNLDLLRAIRALSTFDPGRGPRRRVNYGALNVEELGSVYESLLELRPQVDLGSLPDGIPFSFEAGDERRQTGSYYTADVLVRDPLDHALAPALARHLAGARTGAARAMAILRFRVLDLACGSGHFLLGAARRLARALAQARTGDPEPSPAAYRTALRDVIRHCIYGVDKNPLAVELCKVALWIESHSPGLPLTFLDHHIKHGDSLLGAARRSDVEAGIPDDAYERRGGAREERAAATRFKRRNREEREQIRAAGVAQATFLADLAVPPATGALARVLADLDAMDEDTPEQVQAKARQYSAARGAQSEWWEATTAGHLWLAPYFLPLAGVGADNPAVPTTGALRRFLAHPRTTENVMAAHAWSVPSQSDGRVPFHWFVEFADVMDAGGFHCILGNPPFLGGLKVSTEFGEQYRQYLATVYDPAGATCDLCAYVLRRAYDLLRPGGALGLVATNTIGQGDTREGGLREVVRQAGVLGFARRFVKWPGDASVEVNVIALHKDSTPSERFLDGAPVDYISSHLYAAPESEPSPLEENEGKCFIGSYVLGLGFVLEPEEAQTLIELDPRNTDVVMPYLGGEDLNSRPDRTPARWVINFHDWPVERAERYPSVFDIVLRLVKPERDRVQRDRNRQRWWLYAENRPGLIRAITPLSRVLVRSRVSENHLLAFVPKGWVYSEATVVFAFDDDYHFTILQSYAHEVWLRRLTSSLRTDVRYAPSDCFVNFPFPQDPPVDAIQRASAAGAAYLTHRHAVMQARQLGMTATYNLVHNPDCHDPDIVRLRSLHAALDAAALDAYGWQDLTSELDHGFHPNERRQLRWTPSPAAQDELFRRLLTLNATLAARQSTPETPATPTTRRRTRSVQAIG